MGNFGYPLVRYGDAYLLRQSDLKDAWTILRGIRQDDVLEWQLSAPGFLGPNLELGISISDECYTIASSDFGFAHVIFGVKKHADQDRANTWLVSTEQGQRDGFELLRLTREFYTGMFQRWPETQCYSAPHNLMHHKWLAWMGYKKVGEVPWGAYGNTFFRFTKG